MDDLQPDSLGDEESGQENDEYSYVPEEAADDDEDYDPSTFDFGDEPPTSASPATPAVQTEAQIEQPTAITAPEQAIIQPKTIGGFIVDDDDEDEEEAPTAAPKVNGEQGADNGLGAVAVEEAQDVSLASEPPQDTAAVPQNAGLNGSTATASLTVPTNLSASDVVSAPSLQPATSDQGKAISPAQTQAPSALPAPASVTASVATTPQPPAPTNGNALATPSTQRLPHDKVGRLEDRIKEDPKADTEAWWSLIQHYKDKDQIDKVREVNERFVTVFPQAPSIWLPYVRMELDLFERNRIDLVFSRSLPEVPNVDMWTEYLNYLRRILPLVPDPNGTNRTTITHAFEAVLDAVGLDPDAGKLWREYVDFYKDAPGVVGGQGWQDQQKADLLRTAYQRAVRLPHGDLVRLWKEYDNFELGLNKATGRGKLQEQSPHYMTAKTCRIQLDKYLAGLDRTNLPVLPPVAGFEGEDAFAAQVERWKRWVAWEKEDPMVYNGDKDQDIPAYRKRILYVYKQAVMFLRFYPPMWFEAANWCFEQGTEDLVAQGEGFLSKGLEANPESVLLALRKADRVESGLDSGNSDEIAIANGAKLNAVFESVHKALYELREKMVDREKKAVQKINEHFASLPPEEVQEEKIQAEDDDDDSPIEKPKTRAEDLQAQVQQSQAASKAQLEILKRTISYVWVAKMRAFRRIQGQGMPGKPKKGFRGVFGEARPRGQLSSEVYIASALMEWHCYKDASALKIFERGLKLFPTDEGFALEYVKHLISCNDLTNARVVFETTVGKIMGLQSLPEQQRKHKARPLLAYMHHFESNYGELAQIKKLTERMKDMYLEETDLDRFSQRFLMAPGFDGTSVQLIISPSQARPRSTSYLDTPYRAIPSIEPPFRATPDATGGLRLGPNGPYVASPKRPFDGDSDGDTPRKYMRAESPLKGAAGRRIQSSTMPTHSASNSIAGLGTLASAGAGSGFVNKHYVPGPVAPVPLPQGVQQLLALLPHASQYRAVMFDPAKTVEFLRRVDIAQVQDVLGR